jgi:hypothetical protein
MKATKSTKATDLNAKLADMTNQPKYFHFLFPGDKVVVFKKTIKTTYEQV